MENDGILILYVGVWQFEQMLQSVSKENMNEFCKKNLKNLELLYSVSLIGLLCFLIELIPIKMVRAINQNVEAAHWKGISHQLDLLFAVFRFSIEKSENTYLFIIKLIFYDVLIYLVDLSLSFLLKMPFLRKISILAWF